MELLRSIRDRTVERTVRNRTTEISNRTPLGSNVDFFPGGNATAILKHIQTRGQCGPRLPVVRRCFLPSSLRAVPREASRTSGVRFPDDSRWKMNEGPKPWLQLIHRVEAAATVYHQRGTRHVIGGLGAQENECVRDRFRGLHEP